MFDASCPYEPRLLQRAEGDLRARFLVRRGLTVLDTLRQAGCLKLRLPRPARRDWVETVTVNTSGGVAAGDRLSVHFDVACGARVTITSQAAERFYRARRGEDPSEIENSIVIAPAAAVEWLPQETILFDGATLSRQLDVKLAAGAQFLGSEMLVFGRALMGETVRRLRLRDRLRLTRDGRPLLYDAIRIDGDAAATLARSGVAGGRHAVATLIYAAPDAEAKLAGLRSALHDCEAGASAGDGLLVARILAPSGLALRRAIETALFTLRARPLPRVWLC